VIEKGQTYRCTPGFSWCSRWLDVEKYIFWFYIRWMQLGELAWWHRKSRRCILTRRHYRREVHVCFFGVYWWAIFIFWNSIKYRHTLMIIDQLGVFGLSVVWIPSVSAPITVQVATGMFPQQSEVSVSLLTWNYIQIVYFLTRYLALGGTIARWAFPESP
jgi:hypothetical protein